ncbi:TetR/AcrR family transcriptional regulator [Nocardioides sp.]|uniref:TetR/AcrR family transcriptional regulator n=1 Tax=Nocardioides sp. TaxID=35761 RepID=UPI00273645D9|nr:TetR/AcrR family transcriptional regulator [Nocardioides sp.]MDP3890445.1 TetR/AcrR family transcriptional regulator [Nocardioides sp.]
MSKGDETKVAILDEALQIASRVGFNALSIGGLAERTEMSKGGLFAHFRSKEALQLQTLEHSRTRFIDQVIRPTLNAPRGVRRLRELFARWLDWETSALDGGCIFITASAEYDSQPGAMRDALVRNQEDWLDTIATVADTAVAEGEFRPDVDTRQLAFELHGLMLGFHHSGRLLEDPLALDRTRTAFESMLDARLA